MGGNRSSRGIFQHLGGSLREVWGLNPKVVSLAWSTKTEKGIQITSGCEKQWGLCLQRRDSYRHREPLKRPTHKYSFSATYPGFWQREGGVVQRCVRRVRGSGERTEGTPARIPVLSYSPYCRSHLSQAEHSPPCGINLRGSNSFTCKNPSRTTLWRLSQATEKYTWNTFAL